MRVTRIGKIPINSKGLSVNFIPYPEVSATAVPMWLINTINQGKNIKKATTVQIRQLINILLKRNFS